MRDLRACGKWRKSIRFRAITVSLTKFLPRFYRILTTARQGPRQIAYMKTNPFLHNQRSQNNPGPTPQGIRLGMILVLLICGMAGSLRASDPIGIYAIIDKVSLLPSEQSAQTIQISGVFSLAEGRGEAYSKPQHGYLFFTVDPEKPDVTRKEWADLKSIAGSGKAIGFGSRYPKKKPTVRKTDQSAKDPDPYPLGWGIRKITDSSYEPVKALFDAAGKSAKSTKP